MNILISVSIWVNTDEQATMEALFYYYIFLFKIMRHNF